MFYMAHTWFYIYCSLLHKIECFSIDVSATNKIDLTCVIIHDNLTCVDYYETH